MSTEFTYITYLNISVSGCHSGDPTLVRWTLIADQAKHEGIKESKF